MSVLFEECLEILENSVSLLSLESSQTIKKKFFNEYIFENGRLQWSKPQIEINDVSTISKILESAKCLVIWDEFDLPVIESSLNSVIKNIDDVTAVSFDSWLIDIEFQWIIEFHHEGTIRLLQENPILPIQS